MLLFGKTDFYLIFIKKQIKNYLWVIQNQKPHMKYIVLHKIF